MGGRCAEALGCGLHGIDATPVRVEVSLQNGLPSFEIVGLCGSDIKEARERVRAAVRNSGFEFPTGRIVANFAPAWIHKQGTGFDLPLALALLCASGQVCARGPLPLSFGELSLTGEVRGVNGALCRAGVAADLRLPSVLVPRENRHEVEHLRNLGIVPVRNLRDAVERVAGRPSPFGEEADCGPSPDEGPPAKVPLPEVRGQGTALETLAAAAAGRHNLLLLGSPGSGKTLLASLLPSLLPPLEEEEAFEVTRIYSAAGLLPAGSGLLRERPFRAPHHTATAASLVGGGASPRPGEATLAHKGVLFLDEFSEFSPAAVAALRTPAEEGVVRMTRGGAQVVFPADFMLVAATNPCPCGDLMETDRGCRCVKAAVDRHRARLRGPVLDRIDLMADVKRVDAKAMESTVGRCGEDPLASVRSRIRVAWEAQRERSAAAGADGMVWNARLPPERLQDALDVGRGFVAAVARQAKHLGMSVRGFHKVLRVARTLGDLEGRASVSEHHVNIAFFHCAAERRKEILR